MKTYFVRLGEGTNGSTLGAVSGRIVKIPGVSTVKAFLHRPWNPNGLKPKSWVVSELTSGLAMGRGDLQADAITSAAGHIEAAGEEKVQAMISTAVKRYGIANE